MYVRACLLPKVDPENVASVRILVRNGCTKREVVLGEVDFQMKGLGDPMVCELGRPL